MPRLFLLLVFGLLGWHGTLAGPVHSPPLPAPPDSLRAALRMASGPARYDALLHVAESFLATLDSGGTIGYALAAEHIARRAGDSVQVGRALDVRGHFYTQHDDRSRATPLLLRAQLLLQTAPAAYRAANLYHLALLYGELKRHDQALRYHRQAYALFGQVRATAQQAEVLNAQSYVFMMQARFDSSAYYLYRAAREHHRAGRGASEAATLGNLAILYLQQNKLTTAHRFALQSLHLAQSVGDPQLQAGQLGTLAQVAQQRDSLDAALRFLRLALVLQRRHHLIRPIISTYLEAGALLQQAGRYDTATIYFQRALKLARTLGRGGETSAPLMALATLHLQQNQLGDAVRYARAALAQPDSAATTPLLPEHPLTLLESVALRHHDYATAYHYAKRAHLLDSVRAERASLQLREELRIAYETEKAEAQVKFLTEQQELFQLRRRQELAGGGALGLLALLLAGGAVLRYRRYQRERERQLRQALSADLHDDVSSLLAQIALQSYLLSEGLYPADEQQTHLHELAAASRTAVNQLRHVVWNTDPTNEHLVNLSGHLQEYASQVLRPAGIDLVFEADPSLPSQRLSTLARRNLYLICKESLHNIVKHADAGRVRITMHLDGDQLFLSIEDDGRGPAPASSGTGQGLRNIRQRAEAAGGTAHCGPGPGGGFAVQVRVPLKKRRKPRKLFGMAGTAN
jgi:signal transduction histidine kinase